MSRRFLIESTTQFQKLNALLPKVVVTFAMRAAITSAESIIRIAKPIVLLSAVCAEQLNVLTILVTQRRTDLTSIRVTGPCESHW